MPTPNVREAATVTDDFEKCIGALPGYGEGANASRTHPANRSVGRVSDDAIMFLDLRKQLLDQETRISIAERVVFDAPVVAPAIDRHTLLLVPGADEEADRHRHVLLVN